MITTRMYKQAIEKAQNMIDKSDAKDFKHFSFIFYKQKLVSSGVNSCKKTHPLAAKMGHSYCRVHAEINAITKFPHKINTLKHCTLVNIRLNKNGVIRFSKPCKACQTLLKEFNIRKCYFSLQNGGFELFKENV